MRSSSEGDAAAAGFNYDPAEIARAGTFVSIDGSGALRIERGYVRPEDEPPIPRSEDGAIDGEADEPGADTASTSDDNSAPVVGVASETADLVEEDDDVRPIPDRLVTELTTHRTVALRDALAKDPDVAFVAALHVLCLKLFYRYALDSCLEIEPKSAMFGGQAPGLADTASAKAIDARHAAWTAQLPREPATLWDALMAFDHDSRQTLFAHCVSLTVNAVSETITAARRRSPMPIASRKPSPSTWPPSAGGRRSTTISAASPKAVSSRPSAKPKATRQPNVSARLRKRRWPMLPNTF